MAADRLGLLGEAKGAPLLSRANVQELMPASWTDRELDFVFSRLELDEDGRAQREAVVAAAELAEANRGSHTWDVPISTLHGSFRPSEGTRRLAEEIGGLPRLRRGLDRFYEHAFADEVLDKFVTDRGEPHGERLAMWIYEKMTGETMWTESRPPDSRQRSHGKAWFCPKREPDKVGRRFKLDDCRVWMRLNFWAMREEGLDQHRAFWGWYKKFIAHFIAVYERTAPPYTDESAAWSADAANIERYQSAGNTMSDVIGVGVPVAW